LVLDELFLIGLGTLTHIEEAIKQIQDVNRRPDCLRLKIMQGDPAQLLPVLDSAL
jgi:hypothetical protein